MSSAGIFGLNLCYKQVRDVPIFRWGNWGSETSTTQLAPLNKEKLLTTEVLAQIDSFLESQFRLEIDEAEDLGEHIISLQGDAHTAGHIVGVSTEVDTGLGIQQRVVVFHPGHRDLLCGQSSGHVHQLDACARLRSLKGALQGVKDPPTCEKTRSCERAQRCPNPSENKSSASLPRSLVGSLSLGLKITF